MMCTVSNLAYNPKTHLLEKIINDKGLELILDTLDFFAKKNDEETAEVCIDALTHIAAHDKALKYLEKTSVIDLLVDILR